MAEATATETARATAVVSNLAGRVACDADAFCTPARPEITANIASISSPCSSELAKRPQVTCCFSDYVRELLEHDSEKSNKLLENHDDQLLLDLVRGVIAPYPSRHRKGVVNRTDENGAFRETLCHIILHVTKGNLPVHPEDLCFKLDDMLRRWADA